VISSGITALPKDDVTVVKDEFALAKEDSASLTALLAADLEIPVGDSTVGLAAISLARTSAALARVISSLAALYGA
jgi:hypothetical protein